MIGSSKGGLNGLLVDMIQNENRYISNSRIETVTT